MKNTASTALTTTWETGFMQVYSLTSYQPVNSWNELTFDNNFLWDGTSNVLIEVCFNDEGIETYTQNPTTYYKASGATTTHYFSGDNDVDLCTNPGAGTTTSDRPNISLKIFTDTSNFTCTIKGKIFNDVNGNCLMDTSDSPLSNWKIKLEPGPFYYTTNLKGEYSIKVDTGTYIISQVLQPLWNQICPFSPANYTVSFLLPNDSSINNNFADQNKYSTINGKVFNDFNSNCLFDSSDIPLTNWQVKLDPGGVIALTDSNGNYSFKVDTGTFTISQITQALYQNICPLSPNTYTISFTTFNDSAVNNNFANKSYINTINGKVFKDFNNNCLFDSSDVPITNWQVKLDPGGVIALTDSNGNYSFIVDTGIYTISQTVKTYWQQKCPSFPSSYIINFTSIDSTSANNNFSNQYYNIIHGNVFLDKNLNCNRDTNEKVLPNFLIKLTPGNKYALTDQNGNFTFTVNSGNYNIAILNNSPSAAFVCTTNYNINFPALNDTVNISFSLDSVICNDLSVSIDHLGFRPSFNSFYGINYCNNGTITVNNVTIEIKLPPIVTAVYGNVYPWSDYSIPWSSNAGNVYIYNIGDLNPGECGFFWMQVQISSSAIINTTHCVTATIYPENTCTSIDSTWDKSSIAVEGSCLNDSLACFTIYNTGSPANGNMQGISHYRVYQNNILVYTSTFQLAGEGNIIICWPTNGNTIRLEADQRPGHPGYSRPRESIENCGTDSAGNVVLNQILSVPQDDQNYNKDIECAVVTNSWDPNDKNVNPEGLTTKKFISPNDILNYRIRFQNTGTDTALNIVIEDTLSPYLNIETIQLGASSHNYTYSIVDSNILQFTFDNILLPDSNVNEPESHGFVSFTIEQKDGNSIGNVIENKASIVFDSNAPVITNVVLSIIRRINSHAHPYP